MNQITAAQFQQAVKHDPAWASKLTEPVEITDLCTLMKSPITHLSPLLHFSGKHPSGSGTVATFDGCKDLKVAEGQFHGWVDFVDCGIERIAALTAHAAYDGKAARFRSCKQLAVASGTFHGSVSFQNSGVEKIENLVVTKPDKNNAFANFHDCHKFNPGRCNPEALRQAVEHKYDGIWERCERELQNREKARVVLKPAAQTPLEI